MRNHKVLIIAPTSDKKHYCKDKWLKHILSLDYLFYDVLIVDNSEDPEYHKREFIDKGVRCIHVRPEGNVVDYITASQNVALQYFRDHPIYDYMFIVESDVFPPKNAIQYLISLQKPVVTLPYFINYRDNHPALCWQIMESTYMKRNSMLLDGLLGFNRFDGGLKEVFACGIGCTMIQREVWDYIKCFRSETQEREHIEDRSVFSDTFFYRDLQKEGIPAYMDQSYICEHDWSDWNEHKDFILN